MRLMHALPLLAALLLSACAGSGPAPHLGITLPEHFAQGVAGAQESAPARPLPDAWWQVFGDPALDALEARALAANQDIAAAVARVSQARAGVQAATGALLPAIDAGASAAREHQSLQTRTGLLVGRLPGYGRDQSLYQASLGASWEIDLFGGLQAQRRASDADLRAALQGVSGVRLSVAADVADAFLQLRSLQAQADLLGQIVVLGRTRQALLQDAVAAGTRPQRAADLAAAELDDEAAQLAPLQAAIDAQRYRLALLCGDVAGSAVACSPPPGAIPAPAYFAAGLPADLLRTRPDLLAAQARLAAADARVGAAVAEYYPKFDLQAALDPQASHAADLFTGPAMAAQGGFGLRWRLFDFGRIDAEVAAAKGRRAEALAEYRAAVLRAAADVETAISLRRQTMAAASRAAAGAAAQGHARDAAQAAFVQGAIDRIDALDAERAALAARQQQAVYAGQAAQASVILIRALGRPPA